MSAGLKLAEFVSLSHLEILNKGRDYDSTRLTITDVNRPGLQFQGFYDYFDPMRLQVIGKAEVMYLKGLPEEARGRYCQYMDGLFDAYRRLLALGAPKEDARFLLPYAFHSSFFCTINARQLVRLINAARARGVPELSDLAGQLDRKSVV